MAVWVLELNPLEEILRIPRRKAVIGRNNRIERGEGRRSSRFAYGWQSLNVFQASTKSAKHYSATGGLQFSCGLSTWSIATLPASPFAARSLRPSCSSTAVKTEGNSESGPALLGSVSAVPGTGCIESALHLRAISNRPASPVLSTTVRPICCPKTLANNCKGTAVPIRLRPLSDCRAAPVRAPGVYRWRP